MDYPYITSTGKIKTFLKHVQNAGIPTKVSYEYLQQVGYKSSNDRRLVGVLKFINFLDSNAKPTNIYTKYRDKSISKTVLGESVKSAYKELFALYPDANQKDLEALNNFFASHTSSGKRVIDAMVATFRALVAEASFDITVEEAPESPAGITATKTPLPSRVQGIQSVAINVQLTLPETTNSEVYEKIFMAMKRYLLDNAD
jgi:hypothetical protein